VNETFRLHQLLSEDPADSVAVQPPEAVPPPVVAPGRGRLYMTGKLSVG
jgi:hypothetical protein